MTDAKVRFADKNRPAKRQINRDIFFWQFIVQVIEKVHVLSLQMMQVVTFRIK
jgi:hypothetical protein